MTKTDDGFCVVVPARRASTRLPDKVLADIGGAPMIVRTLAAAAESGARRVLAAVDDEAVAQAARDAGFEAVLTAAHHESGTSRTGEAVRTCGLADSSVVVNLQADEPFAEPEMIAALADAARLCGSCATAARPLKPGEYTDPDVVKVVCDADEFARYFSRAPIPHHRDAPDEPPQGALAHIGIYAYPVSELLRLDELSPSPLERIERLEQMRLLWHGMRIAVRVFGDSDTAGVDTPADLERARARWRDQTGGGA